VNVFRAGGGGDADDLAAITGVSPRAWSALFVLATAAATGYAGWLTLTTWT
jgi:hypothetical protein